LRLVKSFGCIVRERQKVLEEKNIEESSGRLHVGDGKKEGE